MQQPVWEYGSQCHHVLVCILQSYDAPKGR